MTFTADRPERLDKFLARMLPQHSRTKLARLVEEKGALVNGKMPKPSLLLTPGDTVEIPTGPAETPAHNLDPVQMDLDVRFEDENLLVVNKPRGLATHPAISLREPSLVNVLLARGGLSSGSAAYRPGIIHRLDKETTGLLVVAKTDAAHAALSKQIAEKTADRRYAAIVSGQLDQEVFRIDAPIARDPRNRLRMAVDSKGKDAVTHVRSVGRADAGTVVVVRLETGRTHQIRVHLRAVGHPVVGDSLYNSQRTTLPMQLHAAYIAFDHPVTGDRVVVFAEPPEDFVGTVTERDFA